MVMSPTPSNYKICVKCKHCVFGANYFCNHPMNVDLITGDNMMIPCLEMRNPSHHCGISGYLWEAADRMPEPGAPG